MNGQKINPSRPYGGWFNRKLIFLLVFFGLISFSNLVFSNNTFALFTPTLSASIDNSSSSVNGNQVINSTDRTTEIPLRLTVNTTNRTGYTATISSNSENTSLINTSPSSTDKIDSISSSTTLNFLTNNTWGYKVASESNYNPIPSLNSPATFLQTTAKTNGNELNDLSFGMKLSSSLESGSYENTIVITVVSNPYEQQAIINDHLHGDIGSVSMRLVGYNLAERYNNIHHIKWCPTLDSSKISTYRRIDSDESDYPVYMWMDFDNSTLYFCSETNKIYFNKDSKKAFKMLEELEDIDLSHFSTEKVENMHEMFALVSNLETLDLSGFNTEKVTNMEGMFSSMRNLKNINLSSFNTTRVKTMSEMFSSVRNIKALNLTNFNTSAVVNMSYMFSEMDKLENIIFGADFNTSNVTSMDAMFNNTSNLKTLNLSGFNTSKVDNMSRLFYNNSSIESLDLSNFDTRKVRNMAHMFAGMSKLTNLQLSPLFNTQNVRDMKYMFHGDTKLTSLDLSSFNTQNVTNMDSMFSYLSSITDLNLSTFNTQKVTNMNGMFYNLEKVKTLDLSTFDTSKVKNMTEIFALMDSAPDNLEKIYVSDLFSTESLASSTTVFRNRKKLRGGAGSYLANPSDADKSWLRIDRPGAPGYFTLKP